MTTIKLTKLLFTIIILFTSLAQVTADIYTPSMPFIVKTLHADSTTIQLTMSLYMLGFSGSHLFYGPLSDRIGRRRPILCGILVSILGSLLCAFAHSTNGILTGRLLQGIGLGACSSVGRPILRDLLSGGQLARLGSHLGMINVFVVAAAPILGGYLQYYFGWRANFYFLSLYSIFAWVLLYFKLPETNLHLDRNATKLSTMLRNYRTVLTNKIFFCYTLCSSCAYAGLIAYVTISPFLMQTLVGLTPVEYGWLSLFIALPFFTSTTLNARLVMEKGIYAMVSLGNRLMLVSTTVMLGAALLGFLNVWVIMLPISIFSMGAGFTFSNAFAGAFNPFPRLSGSAGAIYGFIQILSAALSSALISILPEHSQIPVAIVLVVLSLIAFLALRVLDNKKPSLEDTHYDEN